MLFKSVKIHGCDQSRVKYKITQKHFTSYKKFD